MKTLFARLTVAIALAAGLVLSGGAGANASVPVDSTGCVVGYTISGSSTLTITFKTTCPSGNWGLSHGVTVSSHPGTTVTGTNYCYNTWTCSKAVSIANPAGSQRFDLCDQYRIVRTGYVDTGLRLYCASVYL